MLEKLTPKETAQEIGYSVSTLKRWRQGHKQWNPNLWGPRFYSVHGRIFYTRESIEDWERLCRRDRDEMGE